MPVLSEATSGVPALYLYILLGCAIAAFLISKSKNSRKITGSTSSRTMNSDSEKNLDGQSQSHQPSPGPRIQPQPHHSKSTSTTHSNSSISISESQSPQSPTTTFTTSPVSTQNFSSSAYQDFTQSTSPATYTHPHPPFPKPTSISYDPSTMPAFANSEIPSNFNPPTHTTSLSDPSIITSVPSETYTWLIDDQLVQLPRRRSYTKKFGKEIGGEGEGEMEMEVRGEVEYGYDENDSWRRHTRVFGGGVCVACEESKSRRKLILGQGIGIGVVVEEEGRRRSA